jgi:hypothetical protein
MAALALVGSYGAMADSPSFVYGRCGGPDTGYQRKSALVTKAGKSLASVVAVDVIDCGHTDAPGGVQEISCEGRPYSYCLIDQSDGFDNRIRVGVLDDAILVAAHLPPGSPWAQYSGCGGLPARPADLLPAMRLSATTLVTAEVLECSASTGIRIGFTPCPVGSRYSYCVLAENDGRGNRVKVGFIDAKDDPMGFYGPCAAGAGSRRKTDLIWDFGRHHMNVAVANVLACGPASGSPGVRYLACPPGTPYTYCLSTQNDSVGNAVTIGVWERPDHSPLAHVGGAGITNGYHWRSDFLPPGRLITDAASIRAIRVGFFNGGGGTHYRACPPGTPYDYCRENNNDGLGNHVIVGVIEKNHPAIQDLYGRCRAATDRLLSPLLEIWKGGHSTSHLFGRELLTCTPVINPTARNQTRLAPCPGGGYSFCLENDNDGAGNKIRMGVFEWNPAPGDVNDDGRVDCADELLVVTAMGWRVGAIGFDARANVVVDSIVDAADLAFVRSRIPPGKGCNE